MNSLRITGPKQIKAEHLVAMAVHIEWLVTVLSPSNTFTLFMKYFIRAIANAKNKSQRDALCLSSWSCGMPVPAFHSCRFGKDGCLSTRHTCFWFPASILLFFNKYRERKDKGRKERLIFPNKRDNLICEKSDSLRRCIYYTPLPPISTTKQVKKKKKKENNPRPTVTPSLPQHQPLGQRNWPRNSPVSGSLI